MLCVITTMRVFIPCTVNLLQLHLGNIETSPAPAAQKAASRSPCYYTSKYTIPLFFPAVNGLRGSPKLMLGGGSALPRPRVNGNVIWCIIIVFQKCTKYETKSLLLHFSILRAAVT